MKTIKILLLSILTITPLTAQAQVITLDPESILQVYSYREGAGLPTPLPADPELFALRRSQNNPNLAALNFDFQGAAWDSSWNVTSAALTLTINAIDGTVPSEGVLFSANARAISSYNTAWAPGQSTGNYQDYNDGNPPQPVWKNADGTDATGSNGRLFYDATQTWDSLGSQSLTLYPTTPQYTTVTINLDINTIESWLNDSSSFNGIALYAAGDHVGSVQFFGNNATYAPKLEIQYTIPEPSTFFMLLAASFCLFFVRSRRKVKA